MLVWVLQQCLCCHHCTVAIVSVAGSALRCIQRNDFSVQSIQPVAGEVSDPRPLPLPDTPDSWTLGRPCDALLVDDDDDLDDDDIT